MEENKGFDNTLYNEGKSEQQTGENSRVFNPGTINPGAFDAEAEALDDLTKNLENSLRNGKKVDITTQSNMYAKKAAIKAGMTLTQFEETIYDTLKNWGIYDKYGRYSKNDLNKLEKNYLKCELEVSQHQETLEGKVKYQPILTGSNEEFELLNSVPDSSKGLEYKMNEQLNLKDIAIENYQATTAKRDLYAQHVIQIDKDIKVERDKPLSEESTQKIRVLTNERNEIIRQKNVYDKSVNDLAKQVFAKDQVYKAYTMLVNRHEFFLDESKTALTNTGITLEVMRAYVENANSGKITLKDTIRGIYDLTKKTEQYKAVAGVHEEEIESQMNLIRRMNSGGQGSVVNDKHFNKMQQGLNQNRTNFINQANRIITERYA